MDLEGIILSEISQTRKKVVFCQMLISVAGILILPRLGVREKFNTNSEN